jgi:hypothetical protein
MKKPPKGIKGFRRKLREAKQVSTATIRKAMNAASEALDRQSQEVIALRRILISERAQVIYYTEKYRSMVMRECLDLVPHGFLDLSEADQEKYIKLAIKELNSDATIVPHDPEAAAAQQTSADLGKKIIH